MLCSQIAKSFKKALTLPTLIVAGIMFFFLPDTFAFIDRQWHTAFPPGASLTPPPLKITPPLLNALIFTESSNNPKAHNRFSGARGLTQITPVAWKELRRHYGYRYKKLKYYRDIFKPEVARQAGEDYLYILQGHLKAKGIPVTFDNVLAAYVWGEGNLKRYGLKNAPRSVKKYIAKIKKLNRGPAFTQP